MAYFALFDPSAGSFPFLSCLVVFPLLCPTVEMHIHITTPREQEKHKALIALPEAKGSLLTLDTETGTCANSLCGCLTQCCATPKPAFMNSRRIHLDLTGVIRNQLLCSIWTVPAWQILRTKTKLEGSSDFHHYRSLGFVGGKEIQRGMINL